MMQHLRFTLFAAIACLWIFSACDSYNGLVRGDDYEQKKIYADQYYKKGDYEKASQLYQQIYQRSPKTTDGEVAYYRIGMSYYETADYEMGSYFLSNFVVRFPYSDSAESAAYYSVVCQANMSPNYVLDQTATTEALNSIQHFLDNYPDSKFTEQCNALMDKLNGKIEKKDFEAVKLYSNMEQYKAAIQSANDFLEKYQLNKDREEVYYILVKNSYLLAINSVESKKKERTDKAIERYLNFVAEFPNTKYLKEVKGYYNKLNKIAESI